MQPPKRFHLHAEQERWRRVPCPSSCIHKKRRCVPSLGTVNAYTNPSPSNLSTSSTFSTYCCLQPRFDIHVSLSLQPSG